MARVAIVGAGLMGTATAFPLTDNGHSVALVGTHLDHEIIKSCKERRYHPRLKRELPRGVRPYYVEEIAEGLKGVEIIVSGVNSLGAHWIGQALGPHLEPGQVIIGITKGLESTPAGDLAILPDILASELPAEIRGRVQYVAVGGPCIAGELAGKRHSCVVFGSRDLQAAERLAGLFRTSYYHVWTTNDLVGLEFSAALKNAYALGAGIAAGMLEKSGGPDSAGAMMYNVAAALFAQGCVEIDRLLEIAGATRSFAGSLPGAGDMYVTSAGGRTVRLGGLLGKGLTYTQAREVTAGETLEAAEIVRAMGEALPKMTERGQLGADELPLLRALIDIIVRGQSVDLPFDRFFGHLKENHGVDISV